MKLSSTVFKAEIESLQFLLLDSKYIVPSKRHETLAFIKFLLAPHEGPVNSVNALPIATAVVGQLKKSLFVTAMWKTSSEPPFASVMVLQPTSFTPA